MIQSSGLIGKTMFHACLNKPYRTHGESSIHKTTPLTHQKQKACFNIHPSDMGGFADRTATNSKATVQAKTRFECTVTYHTQQFRTGEACTEHTLAAIPFIRLSN